MIDYDFYTGTYHGGAISAEEWPAAAREASAQLAKYRRIYTVTVPDGEPDAEKMAVCAMAEQWYSMPGQNPVRAEQFPPRPLGACR